MIIEANEQSDVGACFVKCEGSKRASERIIEDLQHLQSREFAKMPDPAKVTEKVIDEVIVLNEEQTFKAKVRRGVNPEDVLHLQSAIVLQKTATKRELS